uniref:Uncharacterized protein n=1 Tax=viral metagenome TaxID=1070528 RepID=A0A6C0ANQ9_9ZZZZ
MSNTVVPDAPSVFQTKYDEFGKELLETFPELSVAIRAALALTPADRVAQFQAQVKVVGLDPTANPGTVLPGVILTNSVWSELSETNRKALSEYVRILSMCCFLEGFGTEGGSDSAFGENKSWMNDVMGQMKDKLGSMDFEGLFKKFSGIFGSDGSKDASGNTGGFKMPKLPEKFLKGQLAKLAEEIVRDIKPEDLGLTPEMIAECETAPSRAFEMLIHMFTKNPAMIQNTIKKIGKRLQQKIQSGSIRPQEIAKEAEELMKEFSENTEFVDMMGSFKSAFGFEDMDLARAAGRDGSARLSLVKERLRKKLEAKKAGKK